MSYKIDLGALSRVIAEETESRRVPRHLSLKKSGILNEALLQILAQQTRYDFSNGIVLLLKTSDTALAELADGLHPLY